MSVHDNHRGYGCGTKRTEAARRWRAKRQWSQTNKECKRRIRRQALFPILLPLLDDKTKIRAKSHRSPFLQKLYTSSDRTPAPARTPASSSPIVIPSEEETLHNNRSSSSLHSHFPRPLTLRTSRAKPTTTTITSSEQETNKISQKILTKHFHFHFHFPRHHKMICAKASNPKNKIKIQILLSPSTYTENNPSSSSRPIVLSPPSVRLSAVLRCWTTYSTMLFMPICRS